VTLRLTKETLAAAYGYLATTEPFGRWNMPDADDVTFKVVRDRQKCGWYQRVGDRHTISISASAIGHTASLLQIMAHEMIHLHEEATGMVRKSEHSAAFRKLAAAVCAVHGFDPKMFY
jgi:hypothetical protein